jgi:FkbM family methyltransferase
MVPDGSPARTWAARARRLVSGRRRSRRDARAAAASFEPQENVTSSGDRDVIYGIRSSVARFDGAVYFVPSYAAHRPAAASILAQQYFSPELHHLVATVMSARGGSMVHAGTFFGDMLPSFSRKTPGRVYAFEPVTENYLLANAVVGANHLDNVMLLHAGLGAHPGTARVRTHGDDGRHAGGTSRIVRDPAREGTDAQTVPVLSIDQLRLHDLSLIQLDVEGFERAVLRGARKTIRRLQPVIVLEDRRGTCGAYLDRFGYVDAGRLGDDQLYLPAGAVAEFGDLAERPAAAHP